MSSYVPSSDDAWTCLAPAEAGLDPDRLKDAVQFAIDHESTMDRDIGQALATGHFSEPMPEGETIPVKLGSAPRRGRA